MAFLDGQLSGLKQFRELRRTFVRTKFGLSHTEWVISEVKILRKLIKEIEELKNIKTSK